MGAEPGRVAGDLRGQYGLAVPQRHCDGVTYLREPTPVVGVRKTRLSAAPRH
jgi:hypothetical protein